MIEIKLADNGTITEICNKRGVAVSHGLCVYVAKERGEMLGCCGFRFDKDAGEIVFADVEDQSLIMIEDGLLRAALFFMFEKGVLKAECINNVETKMLTGLGFKLCGAKYILDLAHSFLTAGCGCSSEEKC